MTDVQFWAVVFIGVMASLVWGLPLLCVGALASLERRDDRRRDRDRAMRAGGFTRVRRARGLRKWVRVAIFWTVLRPIIQRDYRLREAGKRPDRWHWADRVAVRWSLFA